MLKVSSSLVQEALSGLLPVITASPNVSILMTRTPEGWKSKEKVPEDQCKVAQIACTAFQALKPENDGLGEIKVDLNVGNGISVTGLELPFEHPDTRRWAIERELSLNGIWLQPDDRIAVNTKKGIKVLPMDEALRLLKEQALIATERELEYTRKDKQEDILRVKRIGHRARVKLILLRKLNDILKKKGSIDKQAYATQWSNAWQAAKGPYTGDISYTPYMDGKDLEEDDQENEKLRHKNNPHRMPSGWGGRNIEVDTDDQEMTEGGERFTIEKIFEDADPYTWLEKERMAIESPGSKGVPD